MDRATGELRDSHFSEFPSLLRAGDLLVLNDSRVIPARLYARRTLRREKEKPTGRIEVMLTEPAGDNRWHALVRPGRKVAIGERLVFPAPDGQIIARSRSAGARTIRRSAARVCARRRLLRNSRPHWPHPAAALHPSRRCSRQIANATRPSFRANADQSLRPRPACTLLRRRSTSIAAQGVEIARVTLHVGLGTFAPLRVERVDEVRLHRERYSISAETADAVNRARSEQRRIVAVGTTVVRTLEAAAQRAGSAPLAPHSAETDIFISPGFEFQRGRRTPNQFSSSAVEPADAGKRLCGAGARAGRLSARCRKPLSFFQLWRLHVSRISRIKAMMNGTESSPVVQLRASDRKPIP